MLTNLLVLTFGCAIVLALAGGAGANQLTVNGSVDVESNGTNASIAYPGGNLSVDLSQNTSTILNFTLDVPLQNQSITIPSNTSYDVTGAFDVLELVCSAPTSYPSCNVSAALNAGDVFSQVDSVCNVHASCTPATVLLANGTSCPAAVNDTCSLVNQANLTITKTLTITKNNNLFTLSLDNFSTSIDGGFANASQAIDIPYTCPVDLQNLTGQSSAQELFNLCTGYAPLFTDWLNLTMNRCFDNFDAYKDYVNTKGTELSKASQDLSDCKSSNGQKDGTIQALNQQVADLNGIIGKDQEREEIYVIGGSVMFFLVVALGILCVFLWQRVHAEAP